MKSKYNGFFDLKYQTNLSVAECFARILSEPHVFESDVYSKILFMGVGAIVRERNYDCYPISETQLHLTLKGGQFTKTIRSRFVMRFSPENDFTTVFLQFQGDLLNLPLMTPTQEIDSFMREKIIGIRVRS